MIFLHSAVTQRSTVAMEKALPPSLDATALQFVTKLNYKTDYTPHNSFGLKTQRIINLVLDLCAADPDFARHSYDCWRLQAFLRSSNTFGLENLFDVIKRHCENNLQHLFEHSILCTAKLSSLFANDTKTMMLHRGTFGPQVVSSVVCGVHQLTRTHRASPPSSSIREGVHAFADAVLWGTNSSMCVNGFAQTTPNEYDQLPCQSVGRPVCTSEQAKSACCM